MSYIFCQSYSLFIFSIYFPYFLILKGSEIGLEKKEFKKKYYIFIFNNKLKLIVFGLLFLVIRPCELAFLKK